ncbi:MAG TPA: universal stress protein [Solirubrobacterales bacterium]
MFKRILVAFDGSTHAKQALKDAAELAQLSGGELTVLSVAPPLSAWAFGGGIAAPLNVNEIQEGIERAYREGLDKALESLSEGVRATPKLLIGRPAEEIVNEVGAAEHDLVVIGSRGRGEVKSLFLGSVSLQVSQACPVPILIVHAEATPPEAE